MSDVYDYTEGQTSLIQRTLKANGVAIDGSGLTISLVLVDRDGGLVPVAGDVSWITAASGTAQFQPAASDLKADRSPYKAKWKVTDGSGRDAFHPQGQAETWKVWR